MRLLSLVTALTIACGSLVVACSSGSSSTTPGAAASEAAGSGSFRGTYAADSDEGDSPFASITFLDGGRYQAIARFCDPSTQSAASCARSGRFAVEGTDLVLTADGSGTPLEIPLAGATPASQPDSVGLRPDDLVIIAQGGDSGAGLVIDIQTALVNGILIINFPVNGTGMSNTGGATPGAAADAGSDGSDGGTISVTLGNPGTGNPGSGTPGSGDPGNGNPGSGTTGSGDPGNGAAGTGDPGGSASDGGAVVTAGAVAQALQWVAAKMPYCGGIQNGPDSICGGTCVRTGAANNPQWNAYRSDCSGLVSFAWGLPAPGLVTTQMAPMSTAKSTTIPGTSLQPGDALNSGEHVMLFQSWVDKSSGSASIIEESDCGLVALVKTFTLGVDDTPNVTLSGTTYYAIRSKGGSLVNPAN